MNRIERTFAAVLLLGLLIGLFYAVWFGEFRSQSHNHYNIIVLDETNTVMISSNVPAYYDTVLRTGLHVAGISGVVIQLLPLSQQLKDAFYDVGELKANLTYQNGIFYLSIDNQLSHAAVIPIISHEIAHVGQYTSGKLKYVEDKNLVYWSGVYYYNEDLEYSDKPWEVEAFSKQWSIDNQITQILY